MKRLDKFLQRWRIRHALRWIAPGARVLDVGCADGALFRAAKSRVSEGIGIDPQLTSTHQLNGARLIKGHFPADLPDTGPFDVITMLAVLEHIPLLAQPAIALACSRYLKAGGRLVVTVPSPLVDIILAVLSAVRLIDGMSMEQHFGFDPGRTPGIFEPHGFELIMRHRFQAGLNNIFVFRKST